MNIETKAKALSLFLKAIIIVGAYLLITSLMSFDTAGARSGYSYSDTEIIKAGIGAGMIAIGFLFKRK